MTLLEQATDIVKRRVRIYLFKHKLPPHVLHDDLLQEALLEMLKSIQYFDPEKGDLFSFLCLRTDGAIIDFLRKAEGYSRRSGQRVIISLTVNNNDDDSREIDPPDSSITQEDICALSQDLPKFLVVAKDVLSEREWLILLLYYWEDKHMREIGDLIGVNESRVSQIHDKALNKLSSVLYSMGIVRSNQLVG